MISIREIKEKDAPLMLEWMHDPDIQKGFKRNMLDANIDSVKVFCRQATIPKVLTGGENLHFAIVDENDEYLGTISLKEVDLVNRSAEYAIILRKKAQGRGIAEEATKLILSKGFNEYDLHRIYLSVLADNVSAINLYEKSGFKFEGEFRDHLFLNGKYVNWKWYGILKQEFSEV